ncbi:hypothetical protein B0H19DRAFT_466887 [Mycena capillaripes]|nr:hypothetical protein B0H19DRAFT_466887 [Mycena capillaripes]
MTTAAATTTTPRFYPAPVDDERCPSGCLVSDPETGDRLELLLPSSSHPLPTHWRPRILDADTAPARRARLYPLLSFGRPRRMTGACRRWIVFRSGDRTPTGVASPFLVPPSPDTLAPPHLRLPPLRSPRVAFFFDFVFHGEDRGVRARCAGRGRLDSHTTACDRQQLSRMRTSRTDAPRSRRRLAGLSPAFFGFGFLLFCFLGFGWSGWWFRFSTSSRFRAPAFFPIPFILFCPLIYPFIFFLWLLSHA